MNAKPKDLTFLATQSSGKVSAIMLRPDDAVWLLVLGHGAGAGMRHPSMEAIARQLAENGIATFRYQFPYMEQGNKRPDSKPVLFGTVRSAVEAAAKAGKGLPLLAGGKSMGGRMTSMAAAEDALPGVRGLVFFGFPLHPAGMPSTDRAKHLSDVNVPMLLLQGTRDTLADLTLLKPVCKKLGEKATLHIVEGGDHSFHVLKSSGRTDGQVLDELAVTTRAWAADMKITTEARPHRGTNMVGQAQRRRGKFTEKKMRGKVRGGFMRKASVFIAVVFLTVMAQGAFAQTDSTSQRDKIHLKDRSILEGKVKTIKPMVTMKLVVKGMIPKESG